jgi:hypothetical protein
VVYVDGSGPVHGVAAVDRLGEELLRCGADLSRGPAVRRAAARRGDPTPLSWVTQHGNRWLRAYQSAHQAPVFPHAG